MSNIEKIVKQAISTFSKCQTGKKFQENFQSLVSRANSLTIKDVHLDGEFVQRQNLRTDKLNTVIYIEVYQDSNVLISIFVLKANSVIPLHDHPVMHGILKVLSGSVHVQSYDVLNSTVERRNTDNDDYPPNDFYYVQAGKSLYQNGSVPVKKNDAVILSESDSCAVLSPMQNNIHEIRSHNGPSAFIDILAPPYFSPIHYIGPRGCTYFKEEKSSSSENLTRLSVLKSDPDYSSIEIPFNGPRNFND